MNATVVSPLRCSALIGRGVFIELMRRKDVYVLLILMVVFLSGVQLLFLGVLGEYLGRVYEEVKRRPHYVVGRVVGRRVRRETDGATDLLEELDETLVEL